MRLSASSVERKSYVLGAPTAKWSRHRWSWMQWRPKAMSGEHILEAATLERDEAILPQSNWFENSETLQKLRKNKKFPTIWCSGCGIGIVMGALIRAIDHLGLKNDDVALVAGIGCTARMPVYMDFNTLHTTHGRALAFATGLKIARPDMKVIVIMGDGDALAIGGNHFIHAARRNIGITA